MGRPARDFDGLFREFLSTDLPRAEFLRQKNINPHSGSAIRNTSNWETLRLRSICEGELIDSVIPGLTAKEEVLADIAMLSDTKHRPDICTRLSIQLMEKIQVLLSDCEGHRLTIADITKISESLAVLQQVQRRSLGLSDSAVRAAAHQPQVPDGTVDSPPPIPVYSIEMTAGGKFKTARPKLLKGAELEDFLSKADPIEMTDAELEDHEPGTFRYHVYFWDSELQRYVRQAARQQA